MAETLPMSQLVIRPQTSAEEFEYMQYYLNNLDFYIQNNYDLSLPNHPKFQRAGGDTKELAEIFKSEVYDPYFYTAGRDSLERARPAIVQTFSVLHSLNTSWGFKIFPQYEIMLTRYGPGGSYRANTGQIIMLTNANGTFKLTNPVHTAIHEIIHIGIEEILVQEYKLTHWEKERLVDLMCTRLFPDLLLGYKQQPIDDKQIDSYVINNMYVDLPAAIEKYTQSIPR